MEVADFHFKPIEIYHEERRSERRVVIIIITKRRTGRVVFMLWWCGLDGGRVVHFYRAAARWTAFLLLLFLLQVDFEISVLGLGWYSALS